MANSTAGSSVVVTDHHCAAIKITPGRRRDECQQHEGFAAGH